MKKLKKFKRRINNFLFDHFRIKWCLSVGKQFFISALAALIYAFGFNCFITPTSATQNALTIVTGGAGGIAQNIILIVQLCGANVDKHTMQSILYFVINVPIVIFGFFAISKRFAIMTAVNVGFSSLFISVLTPITDQVTNNYFIVGSPGTVMRVLFAAMIIGLSSAITFKAECSCGGIDVISYYFSLRKSTSIGKFTTCINAVIVGLYSILTGLKNKDTWTDSVITLLCAIVYLFISMLVVDSINSRNKKSQIEIITQNPNVNSALMANFAHGSTIVKAKGGYSGSDKMIIYTIVSSNEISKVIALVKKVDPYSFIAVTNLRQVYGNFFIKPVE